MIENIQNWIAENPLWGDILTALGIFLVIIISYLITYQLVARGVLYIVRRTVTKYDDIILQRIRPRRLSLIVRSVIVVLRASEPVLGEVPSAWVGFEEAASLPARERDDRGARLLAGGVAGVHALWAIFENSQICFRHSRPYVRPVSK